MTISNFSPFNSSTIDLTLVPLNPTHEPTGSTFSSLLKTAILVLEPGSLATLKISTVPSFISGTSNSNNLLIKELSVLDKIIWAPL